MINLNQDEIGCYSISFVKRNSKLSRLPCCSVFLELESIFWEGMTKPYVEKSTYQSQSKSNESGALAVLPQTHPGILSQAS